MNFDFLPDKIKYALINVNMDKLYEIRLRENYAVILNYSFKRYFLSNKGLSVNEEDAIICKKAFLDEIMQKITEYSIYAFNDRIKNGYITLSNGVRVGLSGECVFNNDKIITIKNISSMLIRIPHEIFGCSNEIYEIVKENDQINSTLICSPPFCGKTTILKDLARIINSNHNFSTLIIDERGEFENISGINIDKIRYCDKYYAFNYALRSLAPYAVITDELSCQSDFNCVKNAVNSGVKIFASCHASSMECLKNKDFFIKNLFDRYVFLNHSNNPGQIDKIYDKDYMPL